MIAAVVAATTATRSSAMHFQFYTFFDWQKLCATGKQRQKCTTDRRVQFFFISQFYSCHANASDYSLFPRIHFLLSSLYTLCILFIFFCFLHCLACSLARSLVVFVINSWFVDDCDNDTDLHLHSFRVRVQKRIQLHAIYFVNFVVVVVIVVVAFFSRAYLYESLIYMMLMIVCLYVYARRNKTNEYILRCSSLSLRTTVHHYYYYLNGVFFSLSCSTLVDSFILLFAEFENVHSYVHSSLLERTTLNYFQQPSACTYMHYNVIFVVNCVYTVHVTRVLAQAGLFVVCKRTDEKKTDEKLCEPNWIHAFIRRCIQCNYSACTYTCTHKNCARTKRQPNRTHIHTKKKWKNWVADFFVYEKKKTIKIVDSNLNAHAHEISYFSTGSIWFACVLLSKIVFVFSLLCLLSILSDTKQMARRWQPNRNILNVDNISVVSGSASFSFPFDAVTHSLAAATATNVCSTSSPKYDRSFDQMQCKCRIDIFKVRRIEFVLLLDKAYVTNRCKT